MYIFHRTSCVQVYELPQRHCGDNRDVVVNRNTESLNHTTEKQFIIMITLFS